MGAVILSLPLSSLTLQYDHTTSQPRCMTSSSSFEYHCVLKHSTGEQAPRKCGSVCADMCVWAHACKLVSQYKTCMCRHEGRRNRHTLFKNSRGCCTCETGSTSDKGLQKHTTDTLRVHSYHIVNSSVVSGKLCNLWQRKIPSGSLCVSTQSVVATHADTCCCMSVVLFLESGVAVVGLVKVQTSQIWGWKNRL